MNPCPIDKVIIELLVRKYEILLTVSKLEYVEAMRKLLKGKGKEEMRIEVLEYKKEMKEMSYKGTELWGSE